MQRHFEEEFNALAQELLKMGGHCERMIQASVKALLERDLTHSAQVLKWEEQVNVLHVQIDEACMHLLALQNPVASDLRAVIAALKINNDLERIGDQACNITQNTIDLLKSPGLRIPEGMARMTELAQSMVRLALDGYVKRDVGLAEHVLALEDQVDALKDQIFNEELADMTRNSVAVPRGLDIILIARNLEKIGDHATNIAEDVIFMVKAKDIRHHLDQAKA
ncbi:MAG TPA: phosphate signaling complex protein PhoU [bacterium]|jgi:phosphate transport system protein|nr:phosphate signaling complex protein PhoU [bacterium]